MKQISIVKLFAVLFIFFALCFQNGAAAAQEIQTKQPVETVDGKSKPAVLVELFTSLNCPRCPPAERLLTRLEKEQPNADAEIITLALHVDYLNSAVRKDEFSSPLFSRRQDIYGQKFPANPIYTPQMVVGGETQFVGSSFENAMRAISENAKNKKASVEISGDENKLKVKITNAPPHENATVFLAVAEDNLASSVKRGESAGEKPRYSSVVRRLKTIGLLAPQTNDFETEIIVPLEPDWKRENVKFVVFAQENKSRKILGAGRKSLF